MFALKLNIEMTIINSALYVEIDKFQDEKMLRKDTTKVESIMKNDSSDIFNNKHYKQWDEKRVNH